LWRPWAKLHIGINTTVQILARPGQRKEGNRKKDWQIGLEIMANRETILEARRWQKMANISGHSPQDKDRED
jgi:hypothetical protein